jgi:hypothetical protein
MSSFLHEKNEEEKKSHENEGDDSDKEEEELGHSFLSCYNQYVTYLKKNIDDSKFILSRWFQKYSDEKSKNLYEKVNRVHSEVIINTEDLLLRMSEAKKKSGLWRLVVRNYRLEEINPEAHRILYVRGTGEEIESYVTNNLQGFEELKTIELLSALPECINANGK